VFGIDYVYSNIDFLNIFPSKSILHQHWKELSLMKNELDYLLYLLEDEDKEVCDNVSAKLVSYGEPVMSKLEDAYDNSLVTGNELLEQRLEWIIHKINYNSVTKHFQNWLKNKEYDLLQVMILIAKYQYRDLNETRILENIDEIVNSIDFEISRYNPPLESVSIINRFLYDTYEFTTVANKENAVKHFALNNVLSLKKGVSSSIAILYLIIASKLDVPISGIVLDNNLILGYFKRPSGVKKASPKLYFYINPQDKGAIVTNNALNDYLVKRDIPFQPDFNRPSCNMRIMRLVLNHLVNTYQNAGQDMKKEEIEAWIEDLDNVLENLD